MYYISPFFPTVAQYSAYLIKNLASCFLKNYQRRWLVCITQWVTEHYFSIIYDHYVAFAPSQLRRTIFDQKKIRITVEVSSKYFAFDFITWRTVIFSDAPFIIYRFWTLCQLFRIHTSRRSFQFLYHMLRHQSCYALDCSIMTSVILRSVPLLMYPHARYLVHIIQLWTWI